jgi:hypothetical protein
MGLKYHIHLPGVVPVHHFFFYLKGIQAVMYGFGLYYLFFDGIKWLMKKLNANDSSLKYLNSKYFPWLLFVIVLINYPSYATHKDLTDIDRQTLEINKEPGRFETYHWILQNTDINDVFLGVRDLCDFPVLATGRKMVAVSATFSNAYLDFDKRNNDRIFLLDALKKNKTPQTEKLLDSYSIKYLVIKNSELPFCFFLDDYFPEKVFAGSSISIFKRGLKG